MTLAPARELQILVGTDNQDWSQCYDSFTIGDPERDDSGLLQVRGKLVLTPVLSMPESMNPRSATGKLRWAKGQRIIVNIRRVNGVWARHPRGYFYIAEPPLPPTLANPELVINLVCALELRRFPQPRQPLMSPVLPPTPIKGDGAPGFSRNDTVELCFQRAGLSKVVTTSLSISKYPINFPIVHNSGDGYIEYAGKIAFGGVSSIYQDNQGVIKSAPLNIAKTIPVLTINAEDAIDYASADGGELPVEKVRYIGSYPQLKSADPGDKIDDEDKYKTSYEYGVGAAVDPALGLSEIVIRETRKLDGFTDTGKFAKSVAREPLGLISNYWEKVTSLGLTNDQTITHIYDSSSKALVEIRTVERSLFPKACNAVFSKMSKADKDTYASQEIESKRISEVYFYDSKGRTQQIIKTTYEPLAAVVTDSKLTTPTLPIVSEIDTITYREIRKNEWERNQLIRRSRVRVSPNTKYKGSLETVIAAKSSLTTFLDETESSTEGSVKPNLTERKPNAWETEDKYCEGYALFKLSNLGFDVRTRDYNLDVACCGSQQLVELAQIQGALLIGRSQGAVIEIPFNDVFIDNPTPFQTIAVVESEVFAGGVKRNLIYYQLDGLEFKHTSDSATIEASLIWLGTIEGALTPHQQPPPTIAFDTALVSAPYDSLEINVVGFADSAPELTIIKPKTFVVNSEISLALHTQSDMRRRRLPTVVESEISLAFSIESSFARLGLTRESTVAIALHMASDNLRRVTPRESVVAIAFHTTSDGIRRVAPRESMLAIAFHAYALQNPPPSESVLAIALHTTSDGIRRVAPRESMLAIAFHTTSDQQRIITPRESTGHIRLSIQSDQPEYIPSVSGLWNYNNNINWSTLNDGLLNTGVATDSRTLSWIQADYKVAKTFTSVTVGGGVLLTWGSIATYLNGANVEWSNDATTWTAVLTNISGVTDSANRTFAFASTTARYWRISRGTYVATSYLSFN